MGSLHLDVFTQPRPTADISVDITSAFAVFSQREGG